VADGRTSLMRLTSGIQLWGSGIAGVVGHDSGIRLRMGTGMVTEPAGKTDASPAVTVGAIIIPERRRW
jgi:hypothetical protein